MDTVLEDTARYYMWDRLLLKTEGGSKARQNYARSVGYKFSYELKPKEIDYAMAEQYPINSICSSGCGTVTYTPGSTASISGAVLKQGAKAFALA